MRVLNGVLLTVVVAILAYAAGAGAESDLPAARFSAGVLFVLLVAVVVLALAVLVDRPRRPPR